jgi:hypothetical protein
MVRKPFLTYNGVNIWHVYDGGDRRLYIFTWDKDCIQECGEHELDVRDLSTYDNELDDISKIKDALILAIDKGELLVDGPVPSEENDIQEHRPEVIKENHYLAQIKHQAALDALLGAK